MVGAGDGLQSPSSLLRPFQEGGTTFWLPPGAEAGSGRGPKRRAPVFYNPAMALSRDLEVGLAARLAEVSGSRLRMWDALAATGIRGLRCLRETDAISELLLTDLQPDAVRAGQASVAHLQESRATFRSGPADEVPREAPFHLVDVDPYGSPVPFVEAALGAVAAGGVLAITATDMAVLAGPERAACEKRYGARPLRNYLCREAALRILMGFVQRQASERGRRVHPLLSYARDHHVRAYLRIEPATGAEVPEVRPVPFEGYTGPPLLYGVKGGPLWTGPLHDAEFVRGLRPPSAPARPGEITSWIDLLREEAGTDTLFYYETGELASLLSIPSPPPRPTLLGALRSAGWKASRTPMDPSGWRTDAPWEEVARVLGPSRTPVSPRTPGSGRSSAPP